MSLIAVTIVTDVAR